MCLKTIKIMQISGRMKALEMTGLFDRTTKVIRISKLKI